MREAAHHTTLYCLCCSLLFTIIRLSLSSCPQAQKAQFTDPLILLYDKKISTVTSYDVTHTNIEDAMRRDTAGPHIRCNSSNKVLEILQNMCPNPSKTILEGSRRLSQEQASKNMPKNLNNYSPLGRLLDSGADSGGIYFLVVFRYPSRRSLFRIWQPRRFAKWKPLGVICETLAANLKL